MVTRTCVCVCLSVRGCMPTLLHGPGCNLGEWQGMPPSCALLGGFAISARVALLWQHNANHSYKLAVVSDIAVFVLKSDVELHNTERTRNVNECSVLALCLVLCIRVEYLSHGQFQFAPKCFLSRKFH